MAFDLSSIGKPLDERYPLDLALESLAALQAAFPSLVLRNGAVEVVLVEAVAQAVAAVTNAANETRAAAEEDWLSRYLGVPRRPGVSAVGEILVTFNGPTTTTLPAGTAFLLADYGVEVATTAEVVLSAATSAVLQVASVSPTTLLNGVGPGAALDVLDVIPDVSTVAVSSAFTGGADPESDAVYVERAKQALAVTTTALGVPAPYEAFCRLDGRVSNALCIPAWDGTGTAPDPSSGGTNGNHVTMVVYGFGGVLASAVRAELAAAMEPRSYVGVTVNVLDPLITTVPVTCSVKAMPGFDAAEVQAAVGEAVRAYLKPETWAMGSDLVKNALLDRITSIPQVDYVVSLAAPAADVVIPANGLVTAGAVTVSVT